jgi:copper transport protein
MRSAGRFCRRFASLLATALLFFCATASPAFAHTSFISADPADGSVLAAGPPSVTLKFSERLSLNLVDVKLADAKGTVVPVPPPTLTAQRTGLVVSLPALSPEAYRLSYSVRDPVDLHLTTGAVVFAVGRDAAPAGAQAEPKVPPFEAVLRWIARYGLALALGAASLYGYHLRAVTDRGARQRMGRRAVGLVVAGALAVALADTVALLSDVLDIGGSFAGTLAQVLRSSVYGHRYLVTLQLVIGVVALSRLARRLPEGRRDGRPSVFEIGPAVLLLGVAVATGFATHASTGGSFAAGVLLRVLHLTSFAVWAGGLVGILVITRGEDRPQRFPLLRSFSPVALGAVALTVASGFAMSGREVTSLTALFSTQFGTVLLFKLGVLAVVLALAARHGRALARGRVPAPRSLIAETTLLTVLIGAGSVLAGGQPAVGSRFDPPEVASPSTQTIQVDDLLVKFALRPNRPGRNLLDVAVLETRRPSLGVISDVSVKITIADGTTIQRHSRPATDGTVPLEAVDLASPGPLVADVTIDRPAAPIGGAHFAVTVDHIPTPRAPSVVSDRGLQPYAKTAALAVMALALLALLMMARRRRRSHVAEAPPAVVPIGPGIDTGSDHDGEKVLSHTGG